MRSIAMEVFRQRACRPGRARLYDGIGHALNDLNRLHYEIAIQHLEPSALPYSGMHAVTVISTRSSGKFSIASTVVLAGLLVGKYFAYSSL
jgi:hypothetical protein